MSNIDINHNDDGSTTITIHQHTKRVQVPTYAKCPTCKGSGNYSMRQCYACRGTGQGRMLKKKKWVTLTSLDGVTWRLDAKAERLRVQRANQLHPGYAQKMRDKLEQRVESEYRPVILPDTRIIPVTVTAPSRYSRGKAKRPRSNKPEKKTVRKIATVQQRWIDQRSPLHYHRCHGTEFICSCDYFPPRYPNMFMSRPPKCGHAFCLQVEMFSIITYGKTTDGKEISLK